MTVTTAQLDGWFKRVYADELERAIPDFAVCRKLIPFKKQNKIGDTYNVPVKLQRSHGITWAGASNAGTAFTLNSAISMVTKQAQLTGSEFVLRETISYGAISRSGSTNDESFGPVLDEVPLEMAEAANFYLEMGLLYGGTSIAAVTAGQSAVTAVSFVVTALTWAPGLWAQMENALIDIYDVTLATKRNNSGQTITVNTVASDTRTVTATASANVTYSAGDVIVPVGAVGNWFSGIDAITTNTGTLFGISASTYNLWKSNTYSAASAPLTMGKVQGAVTAAVVKGLMEETTVLMSMYSWTDINNDLAALRRFADSTKSDLDIGTQNITFYGPNGKMVLLPHPMVKAGEAFCLPLKHFRRVGSSDVTFQLPDMPQGQFFRHLTDNAGIELRNYFDQAILCVRPARCTKITNIVNASLT